MSDNGTWLMGVHLKDWRPSLEKRVAVDTMLHEAGYRGASRHETSDEAQAAALMMLLALRKVSPTCEWMAVWSEAFGPGGVSTVGHLTTSNLPAA